MRTIKFRAWDKEFKKMRVTCMGINRGELTADESMVLMQFTGLHDCKGHEIYEGDILSSGSIFTGKSDNVVRYEGNGFWCSEAGVHFLPSAEFAEVIGNIYEHPHLLARQNATTEGEERTGE